MSGRSRRAVRRDELLISEDHGVIRCVDIGESTATPWASSRLLRGAKRYGISGEDVGSPAQ
jgi:hypothetical protein